MGKKVGEIPDFSRLHKEFESKLRSRRDSNRSKLTVPQVVYNIMKGQQNYNLRYFHRYDLLIRLNCIYRNSY